ncbi:MAG: ribonuclease H-like domain-containing protein [Cytophagales bacterium]|nr:ribonuclease H-like domain-containing protein [Bernardetiaceae bacterium]MDW8209993.1 ribonuclease H-like domain-containing protein [Cytophagales bacterium]
MSLPIKQIFHHLKHLLFIDIKTVAITSELSLLSQTMQSFWKVKAHRLDPNQPPELLYQQYAALSSEFGKIICIAAGYFYLNKNQELSLRVRAFDNTEEKALLTQFKELLETRFSKRTRLVAHNGKRFDFPFLCRRMIIHRITPPAILQIANQKPWEIPHLDTMEMWQFGDRRYAVSLQLLAALFDIPTNSNQWDNATMHEIFYIKTDYRCISAWCCNDVKTTAQVYLALQGFPLLPPQNIIEIT